MRYDARVVRSRAVVVAALALAGGCNQIFGLDPADRTDAAVDAPDPPTTDGGLGPWNTPVPIAAFATPHHEEDPHVSGDGLELYASFLDAASATRFDLVASRRAATTEPWPSPSPVVEVRDAAHETTPRLGEGGRLLLFATDRPGGAGGNDIWYARRDASGAEWSLPAVVEDPQLNSTANDRTASPCLDDSRFVFASDRIGDQADLYELGGGNLIRIEVASSDTFLESSPFVTEDCLTVYFSSNQTGTRDLYVMTRPSIDQPFETPARIDDLSTTTADETDPWVSADGRHLVFASDRAGTFDLYEASR